MLKHFNTPNGTRFVLDDEAKIAVAYIDLSPDSHANLVEIPYPTDTSNYEELELDVFLIAPLHNVIETSKSPLEIFAAKYLLSQVPLL